MIYAYFVVNGKHFQGVFSDEELNRISFSPEVEMQYSVRLQSRGKDFTRRLAHTIFNMDAEAVNAGADCLSYGELAILSDFFTKAARRFGLVREFRENGII